MRRWDGLVDRYIETCKQRGLAECTLQLRRSELGRFGQWVKGKRPRKRLDQIDSDLLVRYIGDRSAFRSRSTVRSTYSILRCMGEFLVEDGIWAQNPLRWILGPKIDRRHRLPKRIDQGHLKALWDAARRRKYEHSRYQALCILSILYGTGIRRGELHRLNLTDWDPDNATLLVDGKKTGQARSIAVGKGVWRCIEAYLPRRHNQLEKLGRLEEESLLVNNAGKRINGTNVHAMIRALSRSAGVPTVSMHQFRHSCASDLLEAGAESFKVVVASKMIMRPWHRPPLNRWTWSPG